MPTIEPARIDWTGGQPRSAVHGDVYFSEADGLAETEHVFLRGNRLDVRLGGVRRFVVGETGFGCGLNLAAAWRWFRIRAHRDGVLHWIGIERWPVEPDDVRRALGRWPVLEGFGDRLARALPGAVPGVHRLRLMDGRLRLTLIHGEIEPALGGLVGRVDAWCLDGFSPASNPAMWTPAVLRAVAGRTRPGGTVATYTAAGNVRRGLAEAGFEVERVAGHGRKRHMVRGVLRRAVAPAAGRPWLEPGDAHACWHARRAIVVGAGIAGAAAAAALADRRWQVTVLDGRGLAAGASGNAAGIVEPALSGADARRSAIMLAGSRFALAWLGGRGLDDGRPGTPGPVGVRCGAVHVGGSERSAARCVSIVRGAEALGLSDRFVRTVDAAEAASLAGVPLAAGGLHVPDAGWLDPRLLCAALLTHPSIDVRAPVRVGAVRATPGGWGVLDERGRLLREADVVVLAAAGASAGIAGAPWIDLRPGRGQVALLPVGGALAGPRTVLCGAGYCTPPVPTAGGRLVAGSTYDRGDLECDERTEDHCRILEGLGSIFGGAAADAARSLDPARLGGRAAVRWATPDRLPLVGALPDAADFRERHAELAHGAEPSDRGPMWPAEAGMRAPIMVTAGHGSRGLSTAPLAGELIASILEGEPWPLGRDEVHALAPARQLVRTMTRGGAAGGSASIETASPATAGGQPAGRGSCQ